MFVGTLATLAVCLLAAVYAPSTHNVPDFLSLKGRQLDMASTNNLRDRRAVTTQQRPASSSNVDTIWPSTKTRSGRHQRVVGRVDQSPSGKSRVRLRLKRGAIVNGFTSWVYEPFDKMGAFRSGRGEYGVADRSLSRHVAEHLLCSLYMTSSYDMSLAQFSCELLAKAT